MSESSSSETTRTAAGRSRLPWIGAGLLATVFLYFFCIHSAYPTGLKTVANWCWHAWNSKNDMLHGRAIPFAFAIMAYLGWKKARYEIIRPAGWGLALLLFGISLYVLSVRALQPRLALIGLPFVIVGGLLYVFGTRVTRHFVFPSFFLYFAIPVPGIQQATALLQVVVTKLCYQAGTLCGMSLMVQGNTISSVGETPWNFDIAEGCSGVRSLMALAMIAAIYANYTQKPLWKKAFLFACALPLALIGNFGRIFTILLLAHFGFEDFASQTYHDWAGMLIFFPIALSGLFLVDRLLNPGPRKTLRRATQSRASALSNSPT
ncbi:exosortase/archaeosortase family protein [Luteolibacter marinus]|uniref:exosortase/archaeosortase family protein n=1 Tax=Luteolibacter marinus TaxID=2776705 RepID=UPI0018663A13|nr:exosortase/archaeosortase family protein [Luteolibacter marinus]